MTRASQTPAEYRAELEAELARLQASPFPTDYIKQRIITLTDRLSRMAVPVSEVGATLPEGLCGARPLTPVNSFIQHCVFTPHPEGTKHSWQQ